MSGVASPWGDSPQMVAGLNNRLDKNNTHLTGQISLTSTNLTCNGNDYISPLSVQNASYYTSFGKKKSAKSSIFVRTQENKTFFLSVNFKKIENDINYLKKLKGMVL